MGKKTSKSSSGPSKAALPYITGATNAVTSAYEQNRPNIDNISSILGANMNGVVDSTLNNPNLAAAGSYNADVLGGKYLTGNPYLQAQIDNTNDDVQGRVNGAIGTRGLTGGSSHSGILARELAKNETNLRYGDYNTERGRMDSAVGQATALSGANSNSIQALLAYLNGAATIPTKGANDYAGAIGSLWGNAQTKTSTPSTADSIKDGISTAAGLASIFSDRRLKRDIERVGEMDDGLGVYEWDYVWGGERQRGVMADEVEKLRPWALGPVVQGFATVNYGAL